MSSSSLRRTQKSSRQRMDNRYSRSESCGFSGFAPRNNAVKNTGFFKALSAMLARNMAKSGARGE